MRSDVYGTEIPEDDVFRRNRLKDRKAMGDDASLRLAALQLQSRAEKYRYGYHQEWCGIPIIRLPDDIVVFQEIVWHVKPRFIVETGVARGGSLILSASLMAMAQISPRVLGLDIQILEHAKQAIRNSPFAAYIELSEMDSAGAAAKAVVETFIGETDGIGPGLLVLDSDHSHAHVLGELLNHAPAMPIDSLILVADTLIEEFPPGHYPDRPWDNGDNPLTAVKEFLSQNSDYRISEKWSRRGLITEFRDGVLERYR